MGLASIVGAAYVNDPLVFHGKASARLAAELLKGMRRVGAESGRIDLPLLIMQGSEDKYVNPAGAQILYDKVGSKDKTIRIFDGMYHELFNEPEHASVLEEVENWLSVRVQQCMAIGEQQE